MSRVDKSAIVRAAEEVVREKGARKLTLDAVAAQCGLSKGGLIHHFRTKQSLLKAMLESAIAREDATAESCAMAGGDLLTCRLSSIFELMEDDEGLPRSLIAAVAEDPALLEPVKTKEAELRSEISRTYKDPELAQLLILAAQGLFFGRVLGVVEPEDPMLDRLRERLLMLSADLA
ncbi:TetR/AcrR family transcriptional regulator [Microbulbifer sp. THAF38]|uniref:TetR/AcrR family transcriptional regulator n=1 Tax=Microbulbifer sp. THAF38 TaxID=2587856 RepID=UPI0012A78290|nr:TetR/AcrR family transcriptional regulator [Microbulbifer sp. THAF38]QFT55454.1 transcriptional regulator BetI [Microbulbifer sp. THAF38]